jgi:RNA polymerase sigma-70 factor (ECF subfamily)
MFASDPLSDRFRRLHGAVSGTTQLATAGAMSALAAVASDVVTPVEETDRTTGQAVDQIAADQIVVEIAPPPLPDASVPVLGTAAESDPPLLESLLRASVAGEPRARERLLAEIHPLVLRYCRARLGRQETVMGSADDVAQEVCLAVVNALPGYTLRGLSFRAFVYGIAAHKVTDAFRAIGRNRSEPVADIPDTPLAHDGPEHHLLQVELTERLGALLHLLTPRQREVLVLRIAVGLSAEETAQAVGSTPGAVRVTQHRALNRLRRKVVTAGVDAGDEQDDEE